MRRRRRRVVRKERKKKEEVFSELPSFFGKKGGRNSVLFVSSEFYEGRSP